MESSHLPPGVIGSFLENGKRVEITKKEADADARNGAVEFGRGDEARGVELALHANEVRGGGSVKANPCSPSTWKCSSKTAS